MHPKTVSRLTFPVRALFLATGALIMLASASVSAADPAPATLIDDGFDYANPAAMEASGWTALKGSASFFDFDSGDGRALRLPNARIKKAFFSTDTTLDSFSLTASVALTKFTSGLYILVTSAPDADGKIYGYGISWFSGTATGGNAPYGTFMIDTIDGVAESSLAYGYTVAPSGVTSSSSVSSGITISGTAANPVAGSEFGSVTLTWDKASGILNVFLGSGTTPALSITSTAYSSFSQLYVSGNDTGYFDQITLSASSPIPEPGTYALLAGSLAGVLVALRRFRRRLAARGLA